MMSKNTIAVIGEGITEKYYIESLKGRSPFTIMPRVLKNRASSLDKLEDYIVEAIEKGYDEVYCLIDMDSKTEGKEKDKYLRLKRKFHNKVHGKKKKGISCKVQFIESERCTELWFLYHFTNSSISRKFMSYEEIERELRKFRPNYEKTEKYFRRTVDLHGDLTDKTKPNGSLELAKKNAKQSILSRNRDGRNYTYSEMHLLMEALDIK